jgi:hypothetical protein
MKEREPERGIVKTRDQETIERLRGIVEEQRLSIAALNAAIGGPGSLTTDNLTTVERLRGLLRECIPSLQRDGRPHVVTMVQAALGDIVATVQPTAVQQPCWRGKPESEWTGLCPECIKCAADKG